MNTECNYYDFCILIIIVSQTFIAIYISNIYSLSSD